MIKKIFFILVGALCILNTCFALDYFNTDSSDTIRATTNEVVNTDGIGIDPMRDGSTNVGTKLQGTINEPIANSTYAQSRMTVLVRNVVNYFLGFLGLVALIYLAYNGFGILTAGGDDTKAQKGYKGLNYSLYALLGVGFTWMMVSWAISLVEKFFIGS